MSSRFSLGQLCSHCDDYLSTILQHRRRLEHTPWVKQVNKPIQRFSVAVYAICALPKEHLPCAVQSVNDGIMSKSRSTAAVFQPTRFAGPEDLLFVLFAQLRLHRLRLTLQDVTFSPLEIRLQFCLN